MQNMKNIINASIQRNFLESLRKYISAFVSAFFNRKMMKPHTESLPIVHRAIPLGAKVGSRYFFADGMIHIRFSISQLQNYMTEQGVTTVHYDFSSGWTFGSNSRIIMDAGSVPTSQFADRMASIFWSNAEFIVLRNTGTLHPVMVTVKQNMLEAMKTGNFGPHGLKDCLEQRDANSFKSATTSPDFVIQEGKVVCIAPYREHDDNTIRKKKDYDELKHFLYSNTVVYNYKHVKDLGRDVGKLKGFRRACGVPDSGGGYNVPLNRFIYLEEQPKLHSVFRVHRLKHKRHRVYESVNHMYYYMVILDEDGGIRCKQITRRI